MLGALLAEMAERVDVRVLVWAGSPLPVFHPTRAEVADAIRTLTRRTRIRCEADPREHPFHCHHEKTVIVDGRVAFVGGIDLTDQAGRPLRLLASIRAGAGWAGTTWALASRARRSPTSTRTSRCAGPR